MLPALGLLLGFQLAGEAAALLSPLPLPGPVLGMALLFLWLIAGAPVPGGLARVGAGLLAQLSLLFVPAGVGVVLHLDRLAGEGWAIATALTVSTALGVAATGLTYRWAMGRWRR